MGLRWAEDLLADAPGLSGAVAWNERDIPRTLIHSWAWDSARALARVLGKGPGVIQSTSTTRRE